MWYVVEKIEADVKFLLSCAYCLPTVQQNCKKSKQNQKEKLLTSKTNKHTYINEYILLLGFTDCLSAILSGLHAKTITNSSCIKLFFLNYYNFFTISQTYLQTHLSYIEF